MLFHMSVKLVIHPEGSHRYKMFVNEMLRRIFRAKREDVPNNVKNNT